MVWREVVNVEFQVSGLILMGTSWCGVLLDCAASYTLLTISYHADLSGNRSVRAQK